MLVASYYRSVFYRPILAARSGLEINYSFIPYATTMLGSRIGPVSLKENYTACGSTVNISSRLGKGKSASIIIKVYRSPRCLGLSLKNRAVTIYLTLCSRVVFSCSTVARLLELLAVSSRPRCLPLLLPLSAFLFSLGAI